MTILNVKEWLATKPEDRKELIEAGKVTKEEEQILENKIQDKCGCFEETIYHKILDIGHEYYLMQEDKSKEEFLNKLREDDSMRTKRIVRIMAGCFDEYDLYMAKKGLSRDHFEKH